MSENVSNAHILQAITELTHQVQNNTKQIQDLSKNLSETDEKLTEKIEETDQKLTQRIEETEERLTERINKLDSKLSVLSDSLLDTQAEVKILKQAEQ